MYIYINNYINNCVTFEVLNYFALWQLQLNIIELFITILMNPIIRIIKSAPFYPVCMKSFFKINSLYKHKLIEENEKKDKN